MNPLVEIVLVNYNGFEDTVECIKSLTKIQYDNYIIVVVDNASTVEPLNEQIEYISHNAIFIQSDANLGFAGGNNFGIKKTAYLNPDYILLLNNDTIVTADFLLKLVEVAEENENVGIVCGKICYYSAPEILWFAGGTYNAVTCRVTNAGLGHVDDDHDSYVKPIEFSTGCMQLIPIATWNEIGPMEESLFLYAEDTDFSRKVRIAGYQILYRNDAIIYHKVSRSTGAESDNTQYYLVRNELYIIDHYSTKKYYAYAVNILHFVIDIIKGRKRIRPVVQGITDFCKGNFGRRKG